MTASYRTIHNDTKSGCVMAIRAGFVPQKTRPSNALTPRIYCSFLSCVISEGFTEGGRTTVCASTTLCRGRGAISRNTGDKKCVEIFGRRSDNRLTRRRSGRIDAHRKPQVFTRWRRQSPCTARLSIWPAQTEAEHARTSLSKLASSSAESAAIFRFRNRGSSVISC